MAKKQKRFERKSNIRELRPVFLIATEGGKTEPDYLNMRIFKSREASIKIEVLPSRKNSSPLSVLKRMEKYIRDYEIKKRDQIWLVIDKDQWEDEDLEKLYKWSKEYQYRNLAVSNPQFEYWLLLHFEDGYNIQGKRDCMKRLNCHCPNYDKSQLPVEKFTPDKIKDAVRRAKTKDNPPCEKWPIKTGTTVYRMIERLI
jgi:hypothetical protein